MTQCQTIAAGEIEPVSLLIDVAAILHDSFPEFYGLFTSPDKELFANLTNQMLKPSTEISDTYVLVDNGTVLGALSWYPAEQAAIRQMSSLKSLIALPDTPKDIMSNLVSFRNSVPSADLEGAYLARIAIKAEYQGKGLGKALLQDFEAKALDEGFTRTCLHVHQDNAKGIGFYKAAGYTIRKQAKANYFVMTKSIG